MTNSDVDTCDVCMNRAVIWFLGLLTDVLHKRCTYHSETLSKEVTEQRLTRDEAIVYIVHES